MNIRKKTVFFDASVLFAALYSFTGGSHILGEHVKKGTIAGITSQTVIEELYENTVKLKNISKINIDEYVIENNFMVCGETPYGELYKWKGKIEEKDIHVLMGALSTGCQYLVTLDKKHLHNKKIQDCCKEIQIVSPKELLNIIKSSLSP